MHPFSIQIADSKSYGISSLGVTENGPRSIESVESSTRVSSMAPPSLFILAICIISISGNFYRCNLVFLKSPWQVSQFILDNVNCTIYEEGIS